MPSPLSNISSAPDLLGEPTSITYLHDRNGMRSEVTGTIDLRAEATPLGAYTLAVSGFTPPLPEAARSLGFSSFSGTGSLNADGTISASPGAGILLTGDMGVDIRNPAVTVAAAPGAAGITAGIIADSINGTSPLTARISYEIADGRLTGFSGDTSLVRLLRGRVDQLMAAGRSAVKTEIEETFRDRIAGEFAEYGDLLSRIEAATGRSRDELAEAETYRNLIEEQRSAAEERIENYLRDQEERLRDEAEQQVEEQLEQGRERLEDEVRRRLPIPGF